MERKWSFLIRWEEEKEELIERSRDLSWRNFGRKIYFFQPSFVPYKEGHFHSTKTFPSISITGNFCSLRCDHCEGMLLRTMMHALSPSELISLCEGLERGGSVGCLISGGCLPDGSVPIYRFLDAIAEIKRRLKLKIVVHTGLVDPSVAKEIGEIGVDAALIDVIGSDDTVREIYHLETGVDSYDKALEALSASKVPLIPHVLVGLHYGKLKGEFKALEMISRHHPSAVVLIVFTPVKGTAMADFPPPDPYSVAKVMAAARFMMPQVPVVLGCVRPKRRLRSRIDSLAVRVGVNGIAYPTDEAIKLSRDMGLEAIYTPVCCSQIYEVFTRGKIEI